MDSSALAEEFEDKLSLTTERQSKELSVEKSSLDIEEKLLEIDETQIKVIIFRLQDSFFIWIGLPSSSSMSTLSIGSFNKFANKALSSEILNESQENSERASAMCERISTKLNKTCFVSLDLPPGVNDLFVVRIQKEIINLLI